MKVPYSWLLDFVDIDVTPEELSDRLVKTGFEIEEIIRESETIKNVVIGKITSIEKHPNADKLSICKVMAGERTYQIVTGAKNVKVGDNVPCCLDGAVLPNGKTINKGELRGVLSEGMLCSGGELGLSEADFAGAGVDGIWILPENVRNGQNITEYIGLDDVILDVGVTANRPDCNSIIGIAREVSAVLRKPFHAPRIADIKEVGDINSMLKVDVLNQKLCPRYMAKAIKNVEVKASPMWLQKRLRKVGLRPINNIVDITNYILIEVGQPMHAFDYENLEGKSIIVRNANDGEKLITLDGKENTLTSKNLVICDAVKPQALAGIMGGLNSGVSKDTKTVVFESARFARDNIRRSSRELGIRSDSSSRYEKGIDFESQQLAINRAITLLTDEQGGEVVGGVIDILSGDISERTITVDMSKIDGILGLSIPIAVAKDILDSLCLKTVIKGNTLHVTIPQYREDIVGENDIAEELIREYGYDNITSTLFADAHQTKGGYNEKLRLTNTIKTLLSGALGYMEIATYSFTTPKFADMLMLSADDQRRKVVTLLNPLGEDISVMRTTLIGSMLEVLAANQSKGNKLLRAYEIAKTYVPKSLPLIEQPIETQKLCLAAYGESDFYTLKQAISTVADYLNIELSYTRSQEAFLHKGISCDIYLQDTRIGYLGEVHPTVSENFKLLQKCYVLEIDFDILLEASHEFLPFVAIPKFPSIDRDLAFVVDKDLPGGDLLGSMKDYGGALLESINIFDVYCGKGIPSDKKSIAFNLVFRKSDGTLKDDDVNPIIDGLINMMETKYNAKLRS